MKKVQITLAAVLGLCALSGCGSPVETSSQKNSPADKAPDESQFTYTKNISEIKNFRDPFIFANEAYGVYYMVGTYKNAMSADQKGVSCFKSKDLENWSGPFSLLRNDAQELSSDIYWAPEIYKLGEKYYMFVTVKHGEFRSTAAYTSYSMEDEFEFKGYATPSGSDCIDATYYAEDGKEYAVYCDEWVSQKDGVGLVSCVELDEEKTAVPGTRKELFRATDSPLATQYAGKAFITDGCFMFRNGFGELFLLWSSYRDGNYIQTYAVSDNGCIDGDWKHASEALYARDGGHGMFFRDFEGGLRCVLHIENNDTNATRPKIYGVDASVKGVLRFK